MLADTRNEQRQDVIRIRKKQGLAYNCGANIHRVQGIAIFREKKLCPDFSPVPARRRPGLHNRKPGCSSRIRPSIEAMQILDFVLRTDFITLDALLKATGLAPSGGAAKAVVAEGRVQVDGRDELRKTCKIRAGQVVALPGCRIRVLAPEHGMGAASADPGAQA